MTYAIDRHTQTLVGSRERVAALRQGKASDNLETGSHSITLDITPAGSAPLFCMFGVEDATTEISSISQTGASWSRVLRYTGHGDGVELWSTPGATDTGVTVTMSGTQWSAVCVVELLNASDRIMDFNTVVPVSSPTEIETYPGNDIVLCWARRAGGGGIDITCSAVDAPAAITEFTSGGGFRQTGFFVARPRPPKLSVDMTTSTDPVIVAATLDRA